MTNVSATSAKVGTRAQLFAFAEETLINEGWTVERVLRGGKASLRRITRGGESHKVSIRTSQDTWIAFPRKTRTNGWVTLDEVDFVVAVSVNDRHNPTIAKVHMIPGDEARSRFNRAYEARKAAGHTLPDGRGIWLSLYDEDASEPVGHVGAGMGNDYKAIATRKIPKSHLPAGNEAGEDDSVEGEEQAAPVSASAAIVNLSIPDAKRLLAKSLGVPESAIKISIEH